MEIVCHTNLDNFKYGWPTELPCVPRVGDFIESAEKSKKGYAVILKVCAVVWKMRKERKVGGDGDFYYAEEWIPEIELTVPYGESINEFIKAHGY